MNTYVVRIQLVDASAKDYDALEAVMIERGFDCTAKHGFRKGLECVLNAELPMEQALNLTAQNIKRLGKHFLAFINDAASGTGAGISG